MVKYNLVIDGDSIIFSSNDFYEFRNDLENFLEMNTHFHIKTLRDFNFNILENIVTDFLHGEIKYEHMEDL